MTDIPLLERLRLGHTTSGMKMLREAADAIEALEAENERLKAAFRVNMLRCFSDMSHEEIDVEIAAAVSGERE